MFSKKLFVFSFLLLFVLFSCSSTSNDDIVISKTKVEKVNSIDEIINSIPKYESLYKTKDTEDKTIRYIPSVLYKGSFSIHYKDWEKLSKALKDVRDLIQVSLDFSACKMEALPDESASLCNYLPYHTFYETNCLKDIYLPEGLSRYSNNFEDCKNLRAVFFPKNTVVTMLEGFSDNPSLEEIHLYKFEGSLGSGCFERCGIELPDEGYYSDRLLKLVEFPDNYINLRGSCFSSTNVEKFITPSKKYTVDEWISWCKSFEPKTGRIKEISASSELASSEGKYSPQNIANANWRSWVEGSNGDGRGETITITLAEATTLNNICIKNGFGNLAYYWANNRPKDIKIILDDDEKHFKKFTLKDTPIAQYIRINELDKFYSKIKIVIESVYKGTDPADDCAIDEIAVNAGISRREIYGAYYDSAEVPYVYSPEEQKMLKELYTLDVGAENVRVSKEGFVEVKTNNLETGSKYWEPVNGAFNGTLYNNFDPGTGGGHSWDEFHIYLNPNGEHFLFTWHDKGYGTFELFPNNLKIYIWKNQTWQKQTAKNHVSSLNEIFSALSFIEKRDFAYGFTIRNHDYADVNITVFPKGGKLCLPVPLNFEYDNEKGVFLPYKKTSITELSFGTVDSLKTLGDWKKLWEENSSDIVYHNFCNKHLQIFCYPACFNPDPKIVKYLFANGFSVETEYKLKDGKTEPYDFSALECWQTGNNTNEVRAALIEAGASYSPKMLITAFNENNLEALSELIPLVKKEERNVLLRLMADYYRKQVESKKQSEQKTLDYIKSVLILMQKNGSDISETFWDDYMEADITLMDAALAKIDNGNNVYFSMIPLLDFYQSLGLKIPEQITWGYKGKSGTPILQVAQFWYQYLFFDDNDLEPQEKAKRIKQKKELEIYLEYLLKHGVSINAQSKTGQTILHEFCVNTNQADYEAIRFFVEKGADVNIKDKDGITPLSLLIKEGKDEDEYVLPIAEYLISHNADLNIYDKNNQGPLSFLYHRFDRYKKNIDTLTRLFLENGANPNCTYYENATPLYKCAYSGKAEMCNLILEHGAAPDFKIKNKKYELSDYPLFAATRELVYNFRNYDQNKKQAYMDIIKNLVNHGADCSGLKYNKYVRESLILYLSPDQTIYNTEIRKELMDLFLTHGGADNLTDKILKEDGFSKEERKRILSYKK